MQYPKRILLCRQAVNMRLGFPGLLDKIKQDTRKEWSKHTLYVFVSKDAKRMKLFYWDKDGYAIWYKYVPVGAFKFKSSEATGYAGISGVDLKTLLNRTEKRI